MWTTSRCGAADLVTDGQVLARLDDTIAKLTCDTRRQDEKAAEDDLALLLAGNRREDIAALADDLPQRQSNEALARTNDERTRKLFADGALPQSELDRADTDLQRAEFERKSLEQRLSVLRQGARVAGDRARAGARRRGQSATWRSRRSCSLATAAREGRGRGARRDGQGRRARRRGNARRS